MTPCFPAAWTAAAIALALSVGVPSLSKAQLDPAGDLTGHFLYSDQGVGGGVGADVVAPFGPFRVGGYLGLQAIFGDQDEDSRVLVPLAVSIGGLFQLEAVWFDLRGRVGVWTAATSDGFQAGFWAAPGAYVLFPLSERVAFGVGADGWFAFGPDPVYGFAPGLTLAWVPASE